MNKDLEKIIFDEKQIDNIISNVSSKINNDYKNKEPLFIGLLKGAIPFMTDLVKKINLKCFVDYIKVSSYNGSESTGNIKINGHISKSLRNKRSKNNSKTKQHKLKTIFCKTKRKRNINKSK
jgi:hypoxanthine phosphoribosyltransferase